MNKRQLAEYLRLSPNAIRKMLKKDWKGIPVETNSKNSSGKRYHFNIKEVMEFIETKFNERGK